MAEYRKTNNASDASAYQRKAADARIRYEKFVNSQNNNKYTLNKAKNRNNPNNNIPTNNVRKNVQNAQTQRNNSEQIKTNQNRQAYDRIRSGSHSVSPRNNVNRNPNPYNNISEKINQNRSVPNNNPQTHICMPQGEQRRPVNYQKYRDVERYNRRIDSEAKTIEIQKRLGKISNPKQKLQKSKNSDKSTINFKPQKIQKNNQTRPKNGWAIPEGSPIYTAQGTFYENPTNRQKANTQPKMTKAQAEKLRLKRIEERERREREVQEKLDKFWQYVKSFGIRLIIFILIAGLIVFWRYRVVYTSSSNNSNEVTYTYIDAENKKTVSEISALKAWRDGTQYINFTDLANFLNIATIGSTKSSRFIIRDVNSNSSGTGEEEYIKFTDGRKIASINGTDIVMENTCRISGRNVWVPISFVYNYINGITLEGDKNGSTTIKITTLEEGNVEELSLRLKGSSEIESIKYEEKT